ncbi:MAG: DUF1186 domain-containing protein [Thiotrichaceae bacterium]|nr:DUF1186 domain-containing protein [Thiotrichaceae bacterium]
MNAVFTETQTFNIIINDGNSLIKTLPNFAIVIIITEELPTLLLRTCGGDFSQIRSLVENKTAYDFCRSGAIEAMVRGVAAAFNRGKDNETP